MELDLKKLIKNLKFPFEIRRSIQDPNDLIAYSRLR